jgi:hypothetical protein
VGLNLILLLVEKDSHSNSVDLTMWFQNAEVGKQVKNYNKLVLVRQSITDRQKVRREKVGKSNRLNA